MSEKILVCGFGSRVMKDDGFGPYVIDKISQNRLPDNVTVKDYGLSGFQAAIEIGTFDRVIIFDATKAGGEPGTLYRTVLDRDEVMNKPSLSEFSISMHESELERIVTTTAMIGPFPKEVVILGCEPGDVSLGLELSEPVRLTADKTASALSEELSGNHRQLKILI